MEGIMSYSSVRHVIATITVTMLASAASVGAQVGWLHPEFKQGIMLEVSKSTIKYGPRFTFGSMIWMLTGKAQLSQSTILVTEFDVAHAGYKDSYSMYYWYEMPKPQTAIGNPYFGLEFQNPKSPLYGRVGVRVPVASEDKGDALAFGVYSQFGRFEAFLPKVTTVSVQAGYIKRFADRPIVIRGYLQPNLMIPNEGDAEVISDVSGEFGVQTHYVDVTVGVLGRVLLTESDLEFSERTMFLFGSAASVNISQASVGGYVHIPLDHDWQDLIDLTYGLTLMFHFE
jgi:hypothetical protein